MDITKCLTISSAHITNNTALKLDIEPETNALGLSVYAKGEYGWWIYVGSKLENIPNDLPDDLLQCVCEAFAYDCQWLCIDCDGEEVSVLPI